MQKLLKTSFLLTSPIKHSFSSTKFLNDLLSQNKLSPMYIKQNAKNIIHQICDLIDNRQWKQVNHLCKSLNLTVIDQWELWAKLGNFLELVLRDVQGLSHEDLVIMLEVLYRLRYEPDIKGNPQLFQFVSNVLENTQINRKVLIASYFIAYNPAIFTKYREQFQNRMQKQLLQTGNLSYNNYTLFGFGSICNFWSKQFINSTHKLIKSQLTQKQTMKQYKFIKYLQLSNPNIPTSIQSLNFNLAAPSNTQQKVVLMLADLGYMFDKNIYINGTEIDIYFDSCRTIVEFQGMQHYRINQNKCLTKYVDWRRKALYNRGFVLIHLPFFQWNKLEGQKAQKLYLINNIEKLLMHHYKPHPNPTK